MSNFLKLGKVSPRLLKELIDALPAFDASVIIPPGIGMDAAGLKIGSCFISVTTDPITFSTQHIGNYSVAVNVNDVACLGCRPRWYLASLLLPPGTTEAELKAIWKEIVEQLKKYHIQSIGGHIEVTEAVSRPVLTGQVIGEPVGDHLLNIADSQPGDQILLWERIAIEGTALIAREKSEQLKKYFSRSQITEMQQLLFSPGICVWPFVKKLLPQPGLVGMHDPTEGGVATALHEIADAADCGIVVHAEKLSFLANTLELGKILHFNPLGLLASGCLLSVCKTEVKDEILNRFTGTFLRWIGELTQNKERILKYNDRDEELPRFDQDELITSLAQ